MGLVVCAVQFALGEVSALLPVTGSFVRHAELLVDPALGFAVGWNVVYGSYLSVPAEISAAVVLIQFWTDQYPALWITLVGDLLTQTLCTIRKMLTPTSSAVHCLVLSCWYHVRWSLWGSGICLRNAQNLAGGRCNHHGACH